MEKCKRIICRVGIIILAFFMMPVGVMVSNLDIYGTEVYAAEAVNFRDVNGEAWYYSYVSTLAEEGIIKGYEDGSFRPQNPVTNGEALKLILAACDYPIESLSTPEEIKAYWGSDVIKTAERAGIISTGAVDGKAPATREDIGTYIVKAKKWEKASHIDGVFGDTDDDNAEILYQKGIITGVAGEKAYNYNPKANITRAEISAVIYRIYSFDPLDLQPVAKDAEGFLVKNPVTEADFQKILIYMGRQNIFSLDIVYTLPMNTYNYDEREQICKNVLEAQHYVYEKYPEYFCYTKGISVECQHQNGSMLVKIRQSYDATSAEEVISKRREFFFLSEDCGKKMISQGVITADMSDEEKAKAVFTWVSANCSYDMTDNIEKYWGYSAVKNKIAVCQGYTAFYNTLCKLFGIYCEGVTGVANNGKITEAHMWTKASLNGRSTYIDVTFGDTGAAKENECDYEYFNKTSLWKSHQEQ